MTLGAPPRPRKKRRPSDQTHLSLRSIQEQCVTSGLFPIKSLVEVSWVFVEVRTWAGRNTQTLLRFPDLQGAPPLPLLAWRSPRPGPQGLGRGGFPLTLAHTQDEGPRDSRGLRDSPGLCLPQSPQPPGLGHALGLMPPELCAPLAFLSLGLMIQVPFSALTHF